MTTAPRRGLTLIVCAAGLLTVAACQWLPLGYQRRGEIEGLPGAVRVSEGSTSFPDMFRQADQYLGDQDFVQAERVYREIVALEPDGASGYIGLAAALFFQDRVEEARQAYLRALELEPDSVSARIGLGSVAQQQGDAAAAERYYAEALALEPRAAEAHWGMALALEALGRYDQAAAHWMRFLALAPDSQLVARANAKLKELRTLRDR